MEGLIVPLPKHVGQVSSVLTSIAGRTLWRVICINPNLLRGNILCLALSFCMFWHMRSYSFCLFSAKFMSMKSTTMIPPISRRRSCLASSSAAPRFTSIALASCPLLALERLPLFTSTTCKASVCSMMRYAPFLYETVFPNEDLICLVIAKLSNIGSCPL